VTAGPKPDPTLLRRIWYGDDEITELRTWGSPAQVADTQAKLRGLGFREPSSREERIRRGLWPPEVTWFRQVRRLEVVFEPVGISETSILDKTHEKVTGPPAYRAGQFAVIETVTFGLEYTVLDLLTWRTVARVPLDLEEAKRVADEAREAERRYGQ
jgi:hypothetical protein